MTSHDVDVIIVHHHAAAKAAEAVAALRADARGSGLAIRIIVADNGSTAEERALLRSLGVDRVDTGGNRGYAGAVNATFGATRADSIVLMNEDVLVVPGCLAALRSALAGGAAVAGPQFFWDRDCTLVLPCTEQRTRHNELLKIAARRSRVALPRARRAWREHARAHWRSRDPLPSTALSGALLAFRRDTWMTVGPFDDGFQLYFEENDWLLRVAHAGLVSLYVPAARAIHLHDPRPGQSAERLRWEAESFNRFGTRYYGERFIRRLALLAARERALPKWPPIAAADRVDLPSDCRWPLWVELTPSPWGFPAAATLIPDPSMQRWPQTRLEFPGVPLYATWVDDCGRELYAGVIASSAPGPGMNAR